MRSTARQPEPDPAETRDSLPERLRRAYVAHALAGLLPRRRVWLVERALDVITALALLVVLAPWSLAATLALRVRFHGRATVTRGCGGERGRRFELRQFRAERDTALTPSAEETSAWLSDRRQAKLPALWLVFTGQMRLVGPAPWTCEALAACPPRELARLYVAPGLLRLRPIGGLRRLATTQAEAELLYVAHGSLWMDLQQVWAAIFLAGRRFPQVAPEDAAEAGMTISSEQKGSASR